MIKMLEFSVVVVVISMSMLLSTYIPPYRQYRTEIQNCLRWRSSARHQRLGTDSSYLLMPALGDLNSLPWPGQV